MGAESSRIKITVTSVVFTARDEVLLKRKGSVSNRSEFTKRVTETSWRMQFIAEPMSKTELPREFEPKEKCLSIKKPP